MINNDLIHLFFGHGSEADLEVDGAEGLPLLVLLDQVLVVAVGQIQIEVVLSG